MLGVSTLLKKGRFTMDYYKNKAQDYIEMAKGYDGRNLINRLKEYLEEGKTLLEIGMGPGVDLDILGNSYDVIGSDVYDSFLNLYKNRGGLHKTILMDAIKINTDMSLDCIYSNKVLHHFNRETLRESFKNQSAHLSEDGLILHSFWKGDTVEEIAGMVFHYYEPDQIRDLVSEFFEVLEIEVYGEMNPSDSFYVIAKKR
jgi:cyclopropane fatty-acyl-phospholipid synthase-like methyltransferase